MMIDLTKQVEQMLKPYREIEQMTSPLRRLQDQLSNSTKTIQKALQPTLAHHKKLEKSLLKFKKSFEYIGNIYASIPKFESPFLEQLATFKEIGERLKEYAENTPENFLLIAKYGWFIDLESDFNFHSKVAVSLKNKDLITANDLLVNYYKNHLNRIFESLKLRHPNRKEIFIEVLDAFKSGKYNLLIPSVLTQVDGICFDFTRKKFFIKDKNKYLPQITSELEKSAHGFLNIYLSPLQNQTPIMVREKELSNFPCKLNRHEVLHGINHNYGTEINSLKVISLLKYISDLLTDLDNKTLPVQSIN